MAVQFKSRVFGGSIEPKTKEKLDTRQKVLSKEIFPGDLTSKEILNTDSLSGGFEGSSRTVFARMWTAIKAIPVLPEDKKKKFESDSTNKKNVLNITTLQNKINEFENSTSTPESKKPRVYKIGDYKGKQFKINEPITDSENQIVYDSLQQNNDFLKQDAGITSVSVTTEGSLGALLNVTVEFKVNNFHDYENIFSKYFLNPGATVVLDTGWNTSTLYEPELLIEKNPNIQHLTGEGSLIELLYTTTTSSPAYGNNVIEDSAGDLMVFSGKVIDYSSKVNTDGTWDCSLTFVSSNRGLLDQNLESETIARSRITERIDSLVLLSAAETYRQTVAGDSNVLITFSELLEVPKENLTNLNAKLYEIFYDEERNGDFKINELNVFQGVYIPVEKIARTDANNVYTETFKPTGPAYVSWGWLEDNVFNRTFSVYVSDEFGESSSSVVVGGGSFNSQNTYIAKFPLVQEYMDQLFKEKKSPVIMFPENYDRSWNTLVKKVPDEVDLTKLTGRTKTDTEKQRIPLREVFFKLDVIKDALAGEKFKVNDALQSIFDDVNQEFPIYDFDFFSSDKLNSGVAVIDKSNMQKSETFKEDEFVFKPLSDNSMVYDVDISYQTPSGELQSMIAIQSTSPNQPLIGASYSDRLHATMRRIAMKQQKYYYKHMERDTTGKMQIGSSTDSGVAQQATAAIGIGKALYGNDVTRRKREFDNVNIKDALTVSDTLKKNDKGETDKKPNITDETKTTSGFLKKLLDRELTHISPLLPYNLKLTVFGTHGIYPGDLVNVDYFPKEIKDRATFLVTKVTHDIQSGVWKTGLETQMKLIPAEKLTTDELREINTITKKPPITSTPPEIPGGIPKIGPPPPAPPTLPKSKGKPGPDATKSFGSATKKVRINLEGNFPQAFIDRHENLEFSIVPDTFLDYKQTYFNEYMVKRTWIANWSGYKPKGWPIGFFSVNENVQTIYKKYGYGTVTLKKLFEASPSYNDFSEFNLEGLTFADKQNYESFLSNTKVMGLQFLYGYYYYYVTQNLPKTPVVNFFTYNNRVPEPWYGIDGSVTQPVDWNVELFNEWNNNQMQHITDELGYTVDQLRSMSIYEQILIWKRTTRGAIQTSVPDDIALLTNYANQFFDTWNNKNVDKKISKAVKKLRGRYNQENAPDFFG